MKVRRILTTKGGGVFTIRPDQTLKEVVVMLAQHNIGALVVVEGDEQLVGIISERDVIRQAARRDDFLSQTVGEVMTKQVITGMPQDDVMSVVHTMSERRFRHLPIVEQGRLVGMISVTDIIRVQRDEYRGEVETLEAQLLAEEE
jgi:CBS domain-containing protein